MHEAAAPPRPQISFNRPSIVGKELFYVARAVLAGRLAIFDRYAEGFAPLEERGLVVLPRSPEHCRHNAHMFHVILPDAPACGDLRVFLAAEGIQAVRHYVPLHTSPMGRSLGDRPGDMPVTEALSERLLRLPSYFGLEPRDQDRVIDTVKGFLCRPATT